MRQSQDNILGAMPVRPLVLTMSWPIMLSMLMQAVYNLVDSIYVAKISQDAFLALSYAFPIQQLMVACCVGLGVGFNATLARRLGQKKLEQANSVVCHGLMLYLLCWLVWLAFALFGSGPFLRSCTDSPSIIHQGSRYLTICCGLSVGVCMQFICERILQSTGHPAGFMIVQGSGAVINLILDPIFIFLFDMGVAGAAIATVIGQITGALIGLLLVRRLGDQLPISLKGFRPSGGMTLEICRVAAPSIVMQSLASFMSLGLNQILTRWSQTAVFVLGVYFKIQSFVFMPIFGINNGLIPIISYNYGARDRERIVHSARFGLQLAVGTALAGALLLCLAATPLLRWCFNAGPEVMAMGVPALRMTALAFPIAAISIIRSSSFQSLGFSSYSLTVALLRQVLLLLPMALLLVRLCPQLVWLCFLSAESMACVAASLLYRRVERIKIARI